MRDNHSAGFDKLIKLHAWLLALLASRKNDNSLLRRAYGRPHSCQTQGLVHGGPQRSLCCLLGHSWGYWALTVVLAATVLNSSWQPLIKSSQKYIFSHLLYLLYCVCASVSSGSRRAAASLSGRQKQLIFIRWVVDASWQLGEKTWWKLGENSFPDFSHH